MLGYLEALDSWEPGTLERLGNLISFGEQSIWRLGLPGSLQDERRDETKEAFQSWKAKGILVSVRPVSSWTSVRVV